MHRRRLDVSAVARALEAPAGSSSDYDLDPHARPADGPELREAAVLVPLLERGEDLRLVLTRRAVRLRYHPGQVAFPGGKLEPGDAGPLDAALREAREEIGLDPARVRVLGRLDPHETVTGFTVVPFVGLVGPGFVPVPDRDEVDEVFEVPLAFALDPENLHVHRRRWQGGWRQYYAIPYGPHYVWGATARILKALADRVNAP
jgi:8-oxo-dGTP pyrophosphatase MutT (NUDIX family)